MGQPAHTFLALPEFKALMENRRADFHILTRQSQAGKETCPTP